MIVALGSNDAAQKKYLQQKAAKLGYTLSLASPITP
jgi:hypothetical protein